MFFIALPFFSREHAAMSAVPPSSHDVDVSVHDLMLQRAAKESIDACITSKFVALSDGRVRSLVVEKLNQGHQFRGTKYLGEASKVADKRVLFDFARNPETAEESDPSFVTVVNIVDGCVAKIVDAGNASIADPAE